MGRTRKSVGKITKNIRLTSKTTKLIFHDLKIFSLESCTQIWNGQTILTFNDNSYFGEKSFETGTITSAIVVATMRS